MRPISRAVDAAQYYRVRAAHDPEDYSLCIGLNGLLAAGRPLGVPISVYEALHPLVPPFVEALQQLYSFPLGHYRVVYRVVGYELEVPQGPVEADCRSEEVYCAVFVSELARVVGTDGDGVSEAQ